MATIPPPNLWPSAEVTSSPAVAAALVRSHRIEDAAAEISSADVVMPSAAAPSTSEPGAAEPAVAYSAPHAVAGTNSMTTEVPQEPPAAVQFPLNLAETAGASGPLLELHEFLGTGVQAPYPAGPWPADLDPMAFLYDIPDVWSDPSPTFLRDDFIIKPVLIPTEWPELMRERWVA